MWKLWAKALGEKAGENDKEADKIACIRTLIVLSYIITNIFIIAGVILINLVIKSFCFSDSSSQNIRTNQFPDSQPWFHKIIEFDV